MIPPTKLINEDIWGAWLEGSDNGQLFWTLTSLCMKPHF
jgi:hypothetical protein